MKKVIVIGAGFGGIASAIRLRRKGFKVELLDRCNNIGGRAQVFNKDGFKHDAGPTLITAPFLFKELFDIHNKFFEDYVKLVPIDPWYRFVYDDNTYFDYESSIEKTLQNMSKFSKTDADKYSKMLLASKDIYDTAFSKLADVPFHSLFFMLKQLPSLIKFRSDRTVYQFVSKFFNNDKLRRAFSIQPLLVGGNPFTTTCIYSLIHYLERKHGVYFAMGGTGALVHGLGKLLEEIGVEVNLDTTVEKIEVKKNKITKLYDNKGRTRNTDLVVSNIDPMHLYTELISTKKSFLLNYKKKFFKSSMGLFVLFFGTKKKYPLIKHHTILFGREYKNLLDKIFKKLILPKDISLYLHRPTATDKSFAPNNCDSFYALVPVPNLSSQINWIKEGDAFKKLVIELLGKKLLKNLKENITSEFFMTPLDFKSNYLSHYGAGFSITPNFTQSAWFRFHNKSEKVKNLYLTGAGTHPGAGIPGVLSSAKVIERLI